jgi:hypothetical protein
MVKLIRLKGDSTKNNKEIRNIFSDSIVANKNSRLALRSAKVNLLTSVDQEIFSVPANSFYQYQIGGNAQLQTINVPEANYSSANALLRALQISANSTLESLASNANEYFGIHNHWTVNNNNAVLDVYRGTLDDAGFTGWQILEGDATDFTTRTDTRLVSSGDNDLQIILPQIIPLVNNSFKFLFDQQGELEVGAVDGLSNTTAIMDYGLKYDLASSQYKVIMNGAEFFDTGIAYAGVDNIEILKRGSKLTIKIRRNAGAEVFNQDFDIPQAVLDKQNLFWKINMAQNGGIPYGISGAQCVVLDRLNPTLLGADVPVDIVLKFPTPSTLSSYLGFPDNEYKAQGQPANFQSPRVMHGLMNFPSVLLTILGLDLESYAGDSDRQPRNLNIVDVLYPEHNVAQIEYIVNNPLKLDMKNANPISIRDLTMAFVRDDTGAQLEFIGNPIIVLELYEEDES